MYIRFYIIITFVIQSYETLRCYSCQGEKQCGRMFSSDSIEKKIVQGNDLYDSCSITVNSNGSINRDVIPARICRSSSYQFCCNEDLCNDLSLPPLPALTSRSCAVGICTINDDRCNNSIVYLSSATQSCVTIQRESLIHKSYQIGCSPNKRMVNSLGNESILEELFCCNSPACNQRPLSSGRTIWCYTCDSRITGLEGCSILNISSPNVYNSGSSNPSESCAMIIGLAGNDYPAFTIRTFIDNCINQSLGNVTYGGATFQGRIDCCSTSLCNTHPLYSNVTLNLTTIDRHFYVSKLIIFIMVTYLGILFIFIGLSISIYRFHLKKSNDQSTLRAISDGTTVLFLPTS